MIGWFVLQPKAIFLNHLRSSLFFTIFVKKILVLEDLHQEYGLHPLQNGCESRIAETRGALCCRGTW